MHLIHSRAEMAVEENMTSRQNVMQIRNTKYEIFIASGTNIKYMETTCNKDMENDKQN